jgi:hypothetical protein
MSTPHEQPHLTQEQEDPNFWATWAIGISGAFLVVTTVAVACGIYFRAATTEAFDKSINIRYEDNYVVKAEQRAVLDGPPHWVRELDPSTGEVVERLVIPIDEAMNIIAGNAN